MVKTTNQYIIGELSQEMLVKSNVCRWIVAAKKWMSSAWKITTWTFAGVAATTSSLFAKVTNNAVAVSGPIS